MDRSGAVIPYFDFGGTGSPFHFLHANGYPPACYKPLIGQITAQYHCTGMLLRPLWPDSNPAEIQDWKPFSSDLLQFLDEQKIGAVIGAGHSIGAIVTLRAALAEPDRFRTLLLIDPVLFPKYFMVEWNLARILGLGNQIHPLIASALKRRRKFDDLDKVFEGYRRRSIFRFFSDENLRILIEGLTRKTDSGYELVYSPEWEAAIYYTGVWRDWDIWSGLAGLKVPTLIIRGAETDTFWESTGRAVQRKNDRIKVVTLEKSTHLLPLEKPRHVFKIMQSFLKEVL